MTLAPDELKACCASAYASPAARWLLGDTFHPGGSELTYRLVQALGVGPGGTVADVGSGPGTSAIRLARETGCNVIGVDLSPGSVAAAARSAEDAGLGGQVVFLQGDAEALPLADASVDGVLCECAFCTFPSKEAAASELARVLAPGGRLALSDVTAVPERLPAELSSLGAWVTCLGGALPIEEIAARLEAAGLTVEATERHDVALAELVDRIEARLRAARVLGGSLPEGLRAGAERGLELVSAARTALAEGALGYGVVIGRRL